MKGLIIGANSNIGTHFEKKYSEKYTLITYDIKKYGLDKINLEGIDFIIYLAAIVHQTSKISSEVYDYVNTKLPLEVFKQAQKANIKKFIFMSSMHVYGLEESLNYSSCPITKDTPAKPKSSYGISKFNAECGLIDMLDGNISLSIIRSPLVLSDKDNGNIPLLKKLAKIPFSPLYCDYNLRSFILIDDLIDIISNEIVNQELITILRPYSFNVSTRKLLINYLGTKSILGFGIPRFIIRFLSLISKRLIKVYGDLYYE